MPDYKTRLKSGFLEGIKKGWHSFLWMSRIAVPVSFVITLLQWSGWIEKLDFLLNPLTGLINLPPEAALPILSGLFGNLYAVIAVLAVIPFSIEQMTLIALFNLIAHNLILEGIIQHKSGINVAKVVIARIATAALVVFVVSHFFDDTTRAVVLPVGLTQQTPFLEVVSNWALSTLYLLARIFGIIMGIMVFLGCLKALGWTETLVGRMRPLMRILGLPRRAAMIFMAAALFGVFYAGAVIVEEAKKEELTRQELEYLHIFVAIKHAVIEDPLLFTVLGLNVLWLWFPRLIAAIIAVQAYRFINLAVGGFSSLVRR